MGSKWRLPGDDPYDGERYLVKEIDRFIKAIEDKDSPTKEIDDAVGRLNETGDNTSFHIHMATIEARKRKLKVKQSTYMAEENATDYMDDFKGRCMGCKVLEEEVLYLRGLVRDLTTNRMEIKKIEATQTQYNPASALAEIKRGKLNTPSELRRKFERRSRENVIKTEDKNITNLEKELGLPTR